MPKTFATKSSQWLLLALSAALTACAAPSISLPVAIQCPAPPSLPALSQPLPSEPYSLSVQRSLNKWESLLTGMSATLKPTPPPSTDSR